MDDLLAVLVVLIHIFYILHVHKHWHALQISLSVRTMKQENCSTLVSYILTPNAKAYAFYVHKIFPGETQPLKAQGNVTQCQQTVSKTSGKFLANYRGPA